MCGLSRPGVCMFSLTPGCVVCGQANTRRVAAISLIKKRMTKLKVRVRVRVRVKVRVRVRVRVKVRVRVSGAGSGRRPVCACARVRVCARGGELSSFLFCLHMICGSCTMVERGNKKQNRISSYLTLIRRSLLTSSNVQK